MIKQFLLAGLLVFAGLVLCSSCRAIMYRLYGVRMLKQFSQKDYDAFIAKTDTTGLNVKHFYADTNSYNCILSLAATKKTRNDLGQPVTITYFKNDSLISFHANCYAKGSVKNLDWNYDGRFNTFPPKSAASPDSMRLSLKQYQTCYAAHPLQSNNHYQVIVCWTNMVEKISRDAINTIIENARKFGKQKELDIILINNDQAFIVH